MGTDRIPYQIFTYFTVSYIVVYITRNTSQENKSTKVGNNIEEQWPEKSRLFHFEITEPILYDDISPSEGGHARGGV